jgi:hypothetical protein
MSRRLRDVLAAFVSLLISTPLAAQNAPPRPPPPQVLQTDNWGQAMSSSEAECRKACLKNTGSGSLVGCYNKCRDYELAYRAQKGGEAKKLPPKPPAPPKALPLAAGACTERCLRCYKSPTTRELPACESQCKGAMGHYGRAAQSGKVSVAAKSSLEGSAAKCEWQGFMAQVRKSLGDGVATPAQAAPPPPPQQQQQQHQGPMLLEANGCQQHCLGCYKSPQHREMPACLDECKSAARRYGSAVQAGAKLSYTAQTMIKSSIQQCTWEILEDQLPKAGAR